MHITTIPLKTLIQAGTVTPSSPRLGAAIITGAESGIGRATALALAETHAAVGMTWMRSHQAMHAVAAEVEGLGSRAVVEHLDFADRDRVSDTIERMLDALGSVRTLVNNAAMPFTELFLDCDLHDVHRVFEVNFFGHFTVMQAVGRRMVRDGVPGVLVNVTSVQQERATVGSSVYACAKAALAQLARSAAVELGSKGIRAVSVAPGEIVTAMNDEEGMDPRGLHRQHTPLGRPGGPAEVANVIRFLTSPDASYVTGSTVYCDGGITVSLPSP